jgi:hypothetical protein
VVAVRVTGLGHSWHDWQLKKYQGLNMVAKKIIPLFLLVLAAAGHAQDITLSVPEQAIVGAAIEVGWTGGMDQRDFITIVPRDTKEGTYAAYQYTQQNPVKLVAPANPGQYEVRYLGAASPYATLARQPITIVDTQATLTAPASVAAGASFDVQWTGPNNAQDFISLVPVDTPEGKYERYKYTNTGSPVSLLAPDEPGAYELRYMMGLSPYRTLGRALVTVTGVGASLDMPATVAAGAAMEVSWEGPNNPRDFITVVPAGTADRQYDAYVYTSTGNPAKLSAPEMAGAYEVRYLTGQDYATLATFAFTVTAVTASLDAADTALARDMVTVRWQGPGNPNDYVILLPAGSENSNSGSYAYVARGPELRIATPAEPGDYELRYLTATQKITLASRPLTILPRAAPGELRVVSASSTVSNTADMDSATVAVVLDASGSMLQRLDGERRIDLAKAALTELVSDVLPESVDFTLRVFGHKEADSCRTDLEIPVGALNRSAAAASIAGVEAMNLAKTPIAETLRLAGADLANRAGPKLIILLTDGEETCDGDPAAVIAEMVAANVDVRVNIVGFAIDELMLQETFQQWAALGKGKYFNARNGNELAASLRTSIDVPYSVLAADDSVVASGTINGPAISVDAGSYRVVVHSNPPQTEAVNIEMEELSTVNIP